MSTLQPHARREPPLSWLLPLPGPLPRVVVPPVAPPTIEEEAHVLEIARAEVVESERRYVKNLEVIETLGVLY